MIRIKDLNIKLRTDLKDQVERMQAERKDSLLSYRDFFVALSGGKIAKISENGKDVFMYRADQDETRKDKYIPETFLQFYGKNGEFLFSFPWNGETIMVPNRDEIEEEKCSFGYEYRDPDLEIDSRRIWGVDLVVTPNGSVGIRSKESGYVSIPGEYGFVELDQRSNEVHRPANRYATEISGKEKACYDEFTVSDRKKINFGTKRWFNALDRANDEGLGDDFLDFSMNKDDCQK